jgi:CO dehydrogenase nickel-insertion accessory protein CooC1
MRSAGFEEGNVALRLSIAIAGKGGTGKTTLAALLVRVFRETSTGPILAVDADPNSNLAEALGVEPGRPLGEIREHGSSPEEKRGGDGMCRLVDGRRSAVATTPTQQEEITHENS